MVRSFAKFSNGDVVVGGLFSAIAGVNANNVARYSPTSHTWTVLGGGTNGYVNVVAVLANGDVIAGGRFTQAGGVPANNIARFSTSTSTWSALGAGVNDEVDGVVELPGGTLIVAGFFTRAGSVSANYIARYAPGTHAWSTIGAGTNLYVSALALLANGNVVVGGYFTTAGSQDANHVAIYNPSTSAWSSLGTGLVFQGVTASVNAILELPNRDIIVGGQFDLAGGGAADNIAVFSASLGRWLPLAGGFPPQGGQPYLPQVDSLATLANGDIVAGGLFARVASGQASSIARLSSGMGWIQMGVFSENPIMALLRLPDRDLLVGGAFDTINGQSYKGFARWSTTPACPTDFNCSGVLQTQDIFAFVAAWFAADPNSDFNQSGRLEINDLFEFLSAWFAGC